jgi:hypothetical protein
MTTPSSTITRPDRPPRDPDPDYDELWALAGKLNQLLAVLVAGGAVTEEALLLAGANDDEIQALRFNTREQVILSMVSADTGVTWA